MDPSQLNAMVAFVRLGDHNLYLDPATRYCPFGLLPWEETDLNGITVEKNGGDFVSTAGPRPDDAVIERKASLKLDGEGTLEGELRVTFVGQEALTRRLEALDKDEAGRRKQLEEEVKGWLPPGSSVDLTRAGNWESSEASLDSEFKLKIRNIATFTGRRVLLPTAVFQTIKKYPFRHTKRVHHIYFRYP